MFKIPIHRQLKLSGNSFFSNSNLVSLTLGKYRLSQLVLKNTPLDLLKRSKYLTSNTEILRSSFGPNPFRGFKFNSIRSFKFVQQSRTLRTSDTWTRYNKYYGRSHWNKLKKPALFTALFCITTTLVTPYIFNYTPLSYVKTVPYAFVYSIIAVNGAVFLMWRVPQFSRFLTRYGLLVKDNMYSSWSMIGAAFSHQSLGHLFVNMFVLQSFGTTLCAAVGVTNFAIMYLNSAAISSFISILVPTLLRSSLSVGSLGASGAIFSVFGAFSYLFPKAPLAFFFVPVPGGAWILFLGSLAYNIAGSALRWGRYDYASHIGGSIAGIAYGWWYNKQRKERMNRRRRSYVF
ncbi:uncharacterized protein AC631_05128 [Debaryomyces fabryi]|uniref:Peptidase S54 rhomboid domain-containing protein n=1 Tax=Debaryomyces fabryi TaxID=58627 RepID=A0A0V1PS99_9ASCO|nr:uncharacterized protein AC631_05128 [Debaryomyces fabryi]KRZ99117.1 hypothetical protein AC631_05128 [Debaryomyces fabryi]CUM47936.1 unnamed protein product [Debaryomyces fabryi]